MTKVQKATMEDLLKNPNITDDQKEQLEKGLENDTFIEIKISNPDDNSDTPDNNNNSSSDTPDINNNSTNSNTNEEETDKKITEKTQTAKNAKRAIKTADKKEELEQKSSNPFIFLAVGLIAVLGGLYFLAVRNGRIPSLSGLKSTDKGTETKTDTKTEVMADTTDKNSADSFSF